MYRQSNHSYASTDSSRRLSSNNPFRTSVQIEPAISRSSLSAGSENRVSTPPQNFEDWVQKNKSLVDMSDDEDFYEATESSNGSANNNSSTDFARPAFPARPVRAGSDSSVNYGSKKMASNNPFAAALSEPDPYAQRREPPPVPRQTYFNVSPELQHLNEPYKVDTNSNTNTIQLVNTGTIKNGGNTASFNNNVSNNSSNTNRTPPVRPPKPEALPSYEEAAGPDTARREYPREKSTSSSSRQHHSTSNRPHRSHSDSGRPPRSSRDKSSGTSETRHHSSNHKSSSHHSSSHHKSSSTRAKSPSKKKPEPVKAKNLDTIDKLDVTAFFGGGFHHDGPFDACTPHRNKNTKSAPVAAFPVDGPNNSIAGLAKTDKNEQMNLAFGTYTDDDQNEIIGRKGSIRRARATAKDDAPVVLKTNRSTHDQQSTLFTPKHNPSVINFDANLKAEPIHGSTTAGLGSTTFVDGAPAPKAAEMNEYLSTSNGGLSRKKSLVQRLRKNSYSENSSRRNSQDTVEPYESGRRGSLNNLETDESRSGGLGGGTSSLIRRVKSLKVRR